MDKSLHGFKKALEADPSDASMKADAIIRNTYRTLMTRGMKGCYVFCADRELAKHLRDRVSQSLLLNETNAPLAMVAEDTGIYRGS